MSNMTNFKFCVKVCKTYIYTRTFLELVIESVKVIGKRFLYYIINNERNNVMLRIPILIVLAFMSIYMWYLLINYLIT